MDETLVRKESSVENFRLLAKDYLTAELVTRFYKVAMGEKKKLRETREQLIFPMKEVYARELVDVRKIQKPVFILKEWGRYWYVVFPEEYKTMIRLDTSQVLGDHMCAPSKANMPCCSHFSAASDENGGCKKVRDKYKLLEKYEWIVEGYEVIHTDHNVFCVVSCEHHEFNGERPVIPASQKVKWSMLLRKFGEFNETDD